MCGYKKNKIVFEFDFLHPCDVKQTYI